MPACGLCKKGAKNVGDLLRHLKTCSDPRWERVLEARRKGNHETANRIVRKILGISKPMSEEAKEKLRLWSEAHKDEIRERRRGQRRLRAALKSGIAQASRKLQKKGR